MEVSPTLRDERKRKVRLLYEVTKIKTHRLKPVFSHFSFDLNTVELDSIYFDDGER